MLQIVIKFRMISQECDELSRIFHSFIVKFELFSTKFLSIRITDLLSYMFVVAINANDSPSIQVNNFFSFFRLFQFMSLESIYVTLVED